MKKRLLKSLCLFVILSLISYLTAGCESSVGNAAGKTADNKALTTKKKKVKLSVLYPSSTQDTIKEAEEAAFDSIKKEHPEWDLVVDLFPVQSGDALETKIRTLVAAGDSPDVYFSHGGAFATPLIEGKSVLPIESYLDKMKYWDSTIPSAKITADDGHVYAVYAEELFYETININKGLFEQNGLKVPKTVKELKEVVKALKSKNILPFSLAAKPGWPVCMMIEGFAKTLDPDITKKIVDGQSKFSDEPYRKAAEVVKELIDMGAFSKNATLEDESQAIATFNDGKAAMYPLGTWVFSDISSKLGDKADYMYYPAINESKMDFYGKTAAGGVKKNSGIFVSASNQYPEEAVKLAVEISRGLARGRYEKFGNPMCIYDIAKLGWTTTKTTPPLIVRLANEQTQYVNVYGIVQDVMPKATVTTGIMDASALFMSGSISVDKYIQEMDNALKR